MNKGAALISRLVVLLADSVNLARQEITTTLQRRMGGSQRKALPPAERDRRY